MKIRDWYVIVTHGNVYQQGLPDLYVCHARYGARWVEVKNPAGYHFTPAQLEVFPAFSSKGVGVWVLTDSTPEELNKLFQPPNWHTFLGVFKR